MINWAVPDLETIKKCAGICEKSRRFGSDTALANIYLLSRKYGTETAMYGGALLRYYNGSTPNRRGYGFPLCREGTDIGEILRELSADAERRGVPFSFCLCDERQTAELGRFFTVNASFTDDDSDYIYKRDTLAALSGRKLHRKRNHIGAFNRMYDDIRGESITSANAADALTVAQKWLEEREPNAEELGEFDCIKTALNEMDALRMFGRLLYVDGIPAAMTLASRISDTCIDVHYEKAWGEYAANGAFAVINNMLASSPEADREYINREEDMGIEGLRTAKESYYPAFKLRKYYGVCKC